ncbi:MAG: SurA N-terminal domain-containing protein [Deltaproteobacteria bacterium]|nr:SurA N-terminal domain-containing protein [Deltaproteobacteria bacterium]
MVPKTYLFPKSTPTLSIFALAIFAFCLLNSLALMAATTRDRIVAQVNRNIITLSELQARLNTLSPAQKAAISAQGPLELQVLNMMVDEELITQAATKMGIMVSDAEVNEAVQTIMQENNINETQLRQSLAAGGTTIQAFRDQLRLELLKNKVLSYSIMSRVVVTEDEVTDFLNGNIPAGSSQFYSETGVSDFDGVRMIFLRSSPSEAGRVMARANQIKSEIEGGLPFGEAASRYSQGPGADNGGDPGNLMVRDLQPELREMVRQMAPGQISDPLNGGEVVLLITTVPTTQRAKPSDNEDTEAGPRTYTPEERAVARRQLEQMKMRSKYESWMTELRSSAVIKISL